MNTRPVISDTHSPVALNVAFNKDASCFSASLDTGFCVFESDPCSLKVSRDFNQGIGAAEMLGRANYMALVGGGRRPKYPQNKVIIWDDNKQSAVVSAEFRSPVLKVRLSKTYLLVALQNSVHIYAFSIPLQLLSAYETADNPHGLCCLGDKVIAFPGRTPGQVQLVEVPSSNVSIIPAHSTPLRALDLSSDEETLATASVTGTLIRTFSTSSCAKMGELRRGVDHADIYSIAISPNNKVLAVTSDKATLHVFDLPGSSPSPADKDFLDQEAPKNKWGVLGRIPILPRVFSDTYSFASAHFAIGDDAPNLGNLVADSGPIPGIPGGRAKKGVIGWKDDGMILVVGAGRNGTIERFYFGEGPEGRRVVRTGWKRFLGS